MRCTKCGFISFDFNRVCPKCNRELGDEQRKLNLPFFRPDPPQLLGRLMGEDAYADGDIQMEPAAFEDLPINVEPDARLTASFSGLEENLSMHEEEHDVVSLEPENIKPIPSYDETQAEDFRLDLEDVSLDEPEAASAVKAGAEEDLLDLEIEDDLFAGHPEKDSSIIERPSRESSEKGASAAEDSFNLDDLSFDDLDLEEPAGSNSTAEPHGIDKPDDRPLPEPKAFLDLLQEDNPEGLTREIDMKKFKKDIENISRKKTNTEDF
jgi:hypothetical protein